MIVEYNDMYPDPEDEKGFYTDCAQCGEEYHTSESTAEDYEHLCCTLCEGDYNESDGLPPDAWSGGFADNH